MMTRFRLLAALKGLRGTMFDIFGYSAERRMEQQLIADYLALLDEFGRGLTPANHATALALASLPEKIRGFGHVKDRHVLVAKREQEGLLQRFRDPQNPQALAAE